MPTTPTVVTDREGVIWRVHVEERREAVLSISGGIQDLSYPTYLVFLSEFGHRRRSRHAVSTPLTQLTPDELRAILDQGIAVRAAS